MKQDIKQKLGVSAGLVSNPSPMVAVGFTNIYNFECVGADGNVKWTESVPNLVVDEGLNHVLDVLLYDAAQYGTSAAPWYCGLIEDDSGSNNPAAGDTLSSHAWTEYTDQSATIAREIALWDTLGAATIADNSDNPSRFVFLGSADIKGAFLCTSDTGTGGTLYGAANFTGGARTVAVDDVINVTITIDVSTI